MTYTSDERLCLDAAGNVVDCESTEAVELLVGEGGEMTDEDAAKYGLTGPGSRLRARARSDEPSATEPESPAEPDAEETAPRTGTDPARRTPRGSELGGGRERR